MQHENGQNFTGNVTCEDYDPASSVWAPAKSQYPTEQTESASCPFPLMEIRSETQEMNDRKAHSILRRYYYTYVHTVLTNTVVDDAEHNLAAP